MEIPETTLRALYPHLTDEQLKEVDENLEQYLELLLRIYQRITMDAEAYANFKALTAIDKDATITPKEPHKVAAPTSS